VVGQHLWMLRSKRWQWSSTMILTTQLARCAR